jgi:WD40 repeat protein
VPAPVPARPARARFYLAGAILVALGGVIAGLVIALSPARASSGGKQAVATGGNHPTASSQATGGRPVSGGSPVSGVTAGKKPSELLSFQQPPDSVAFSSDGSILAVGTAQGGDSPAGSAYLVHTDNWSTQPLTNPPYFEGVLAVAFARNGILATDYSGGLYTWNYSATNPSSSSFPTPQNEGVDAIVGAPGGDLAFVEDNDDIYLWPPGGTASGPYTDVDSEEGVDAMAISPDGGYLATADADGTVYLWKTSDMAAGPSEDTGTGLANLSVNSLAVADGGRTVAVGGAGNANTADAYLWSTASGKLTAVTGPPADSTVTSVALSLDGSTLALGDDIGDVSLGDEKGVCYLWDVTTGKSLGSVANPSVGGVQALAFNPDGTLLATAYSNGYVDIWPLRLKTG